MQTILLLPRQVQKIILWIKKMLESWPKNALGSLVETVENVENVKTKETEETVAIDCRDWKSDKVLITY